jgi:hypothetical protein
LLVIFEAHYWTYNTSDDEFFGGESPQAVDVGMIARVSQNTPDACALLALVCLALALSGCVGVPGLDPEEQAVVSGGDPKRAAAVAEMRALAEAGDAMPFPDAFQAEQTARLAVRGEPRSVGEVQAIEAELTLIAERRAAASDPREIAALEARAQELRRLALVAGVQLR